MCENHTGKCLCSYCSGSIAKGMNEFNEKNLLKCQQLAEACNTSTDNFHDLSNALEQVNPVQCFDILDDLCRKFSINESNSGLDDLILKYLCRYRTNGGFIRALKEPLNHRQYLLKRLTDRILQDANNAQKANLTPNDINQ